MGKKRQNKKRNKKAAQINMTAENIEQTVDLSFGDPVQVHKSNFTDYLNVVTDVNGKYYLPPVDLRGLSKMNRANGHHGSCIYFRRNMLSNSLVRTNIISYKDFKAANLDFLTFGNAYLQELRLRNGEVYKYKHVPALNVRRMTKPNQYCFLQSDGKITEFMPGEIIHIYEYDAAQNVYGIPDWLGSMQSALLAEDATLFRRKYFNNGAHLGYIFYSTDAKLSKSAQKKLQENIKQGKGVGNFSSMFLHIANGNPDSIKIIPVGDISQKDEFEKIKNITETDILIAHRIQPVLMGVIPENVGGFSKPTEAKENYIDIEVRAMAQTFCEINERLPKNKRLQFKILDDVIS
ncbi:phage portal protein [Lentisphaerota bacterium WC36G]|nr:phage portal protein [Lentisphaerae bacterium WC36]